MKDGLIIAAAVLAAIGTGQIVSKAAPAKELPRMSQQRPAKSADENDSDAARVPFRELDRRGTGYLAREDLAPSSWIARHFDRCDRDGDGRVGRAEYAECTRGQG